MDEEKNIPKSPPEPTSNVSLGAVDAKEQETTWRSCCYDCNKNAVQYFTTILIIVGIMIFCIVKLITDETCVAQQAYMGLLTLLLGLVAPSPVFKK